MAASASTAPTDPSVKDKVSAEEWQTRVDLAALYRLVAMYDMTDLAATHLTARVPGDEHHFLINPYGLMFEEVTASNLVKVDVDGNVVMETGFPVNPAGFTIHSAVHMARPDVACVAHTHTVAGMAIASLAEGLLPLNQTAMLFHGRTAYHDWEGISTSLDERERLVRDLGRAHSMILRNHGLLACGPTIPTTWVLLYQLEKTCRSQLQAMAAAHAHGLPLVTPSEEVQEHTRRQFDEIIAGDYCHRDWPTYLAALDREDPSYRH
jgi:ribulose-5-phosphate 4-epimerase/fuculose-1-phosphate aldolase